MDRVRGLLRSLHSQTTALWWLTILLFGFGDLATSAIGIQFDLASESMPVIADYVARYGIPAMVLIKAAGLAIGYLLWRGLPAPYDVSVPLALSVIGAYLTIWNTYVLVVALI